MFDTANRASPRMKPRGKARPDEGDAVAVAPPINPRQRAESALAYDLLLPDSATAIANIHVGGAPILSDLRRADARVTSCRLIGDATPSEKGDPCEGNSELTSDGRSLPFPPESLDCVILHGTLDRWRDAPILLRAVRGALRPGGVVAIMVANRLDLMRLRRRLGSIRGSHDGTPAGPRRSLWSYRRLLRRSGLSPTASYVVVEDPAGAPVKIISTRYAPSTAFFGLEASKVAHPKRLLMTALNAVNLLPHIQGRFLILARK